MNEVKMNPKMNYNHVVKIEKILDEIYKERETKVYTLDRHQRNVAFTMSDRGFNRNEIFENYLKTLDEGFFDTSFNSDETAKIFMDNLNYVLGTTEGEFYFEEIALNNGARVNVPGWFGTKGTIYEVRLFKR